MPYSAQGHPDASTSSAKVHQPPPTSDVTAPEDLQKDSSVLPADLRKDSSILEAIAVDSSSPDRVENDVKQQLAFPSCRLQFTTSNDPPFKEFIAHILPSAATFIRPQLPQSSPVPPIHINHNQVDMISTSTQMQVVCPTPLAEQYPDQDTNIESDNFPPLLSSYASSEWSDDILVSVLTTPSICYEDQLRLPSTQRRILPRVAIKK